MSVFVVFYFLHLPFYSVLSPEKPNFPLAFIRYPARSSRPLKTGALVFQRKEHSPLPTLPIEELKQYDAYYAQDTDEKILYLTFDCGYENGATPAILDALKKHQAPAAFFVVGNFVRDNPDLIRRMTEEGHTVANHTLSHPDMSKISSVENFQKELSGVESLYKEITGTDMIKYYRPPQGIYSTENLKMAQQLGYQTFFLEPCLCRLAAG